ncbi:hypothetical protein L208DRAFT_1305158 [Tricholoma matsutake]|nr:hypothetical protein L208DRAFT_1305158 [Tricholoma matsutake 945]
MKSWDKIHSTDQSLWLHAQIYCSAWESLVALEAPREILEQFQVLEQIHLKTSTTLLDPSGGEKKPDPTCSTSKHDQLPWLWFLDVAGDSISSNHLNEFHCVNWLRVKASFDRTTEETILVNYEMKWTILFFEHQAKEWTSREREAWSAGHQMYACKRQVMWSGFAKTARTSFELFVE